MENQQRSPGRLYRARLIFAAAIGLITLVSIVLLSSQASAEARGKGNTNGDVPPAVPTAPTGIPTGVQGTPVSTGTPAPPPPVPTGYPTVVPCFTFSDVANSDWFSPYVNWMACNGIVGGYNDGTFRPYNGTTRGQTTKILVGAFLLPVHTEGGPHFTDVPESNSFYSFVETASYYGIVGGYPCGGPGEPCDAQNRAYYRPNFLVTRAQITKIAVLTARQAVPDRWPLVYPPVATFTDIPPTDPFYTYIETAVSNHVLEGYQCGAPGEPCPGRYFHPGYTATRAQISKITYLAALLPGFRR